MPSLLFVCLGNICRSPLAQGAMELEAKRRGLDLVIDSAGTGGWHDGECPDPRAIIVAVLNGVDLRFQRARQVARDDFVRFDHIVAMDRQNLADLRALAPANTTAELSLFLDWVPGREGQDVADPWFGDQDGFDVTWADVTAGARALADRLTA